MLTLFYVDDSRDDLFYLDYIRRKQRIDVALFTFSSADATFAALEQCVNGGKAVPDLLIADLYMPLDGGVGLIARLREDERFSPMRLGISRSSSRTPGLTW